MKLLPALLLLALSNAQATGWVCNVKKGVRIERTDLVQAYSGQPVLLGRSWLMVVMLPASNIETRQAFAELGLSPEAAERMAADTSLVDRGIRVVNSPSQLLDKVVTSQPALGYSNFFTGTKNVTPCF